MNRDERRKHGLFPSKDVDLATALELFEWSHYRFARSTEALPPASSQKVLAALVQKSPHDAGVIFLQSSTGPWRDAVNALKVFGSQYAWGSKPLRAKLLSIAQNSHLLAATRAAVVGAKSVPDAMLAVLALDGAEESVDALLPHFDRAMKDPTRLDALVGLSSFAKQTPSLSALLEQVKKRLEQRTAESEAGALARQLGIRSERAFRVHLCLETIPIDKATLDLKLDETDAHSFRLWLETEKARTTFTSESLTEDALKVGRCSLPDLPEWLAATQKKLGFKWQQKDVWAMPLRGARLATLLAWLLGPSKRLRPRGRRRA